MKNKKGSLLITLGLLLIAAALLVASYNMYDEIRARTQANDAVAQLEALLPVPETAPAIEQTDALDPEDTSPTDETTGEEETQPMPTEPEQPAYVQTPEMEMPVKNLYGRDYIGILEIPALGLELPVISRWDYTSLRISPCRYVGSAYTDDLIIAAHNYQSHFGRLNELEEGDEIIFTDMDGNVFRYEIMYQEILQPNAVEDMTSGDWDLTLFTCTVGGAYRVTVRCQRTDEA